MKKKFFLNFVVILLYCFCAINGFAGNKKINNSIHLRQTQTPLSVSSTKLGQIQLKGAGIDMLNSNKTIIITAERQYNLAETLFKEKEFDAAACEYIKFYHLFPDNAKVPSARYKTGLSYLRAGRFRNAIRHFKQVIVDYPDSCFAIDAMFKTSKSYTAMGQPGKAVSVLRNIIVLTSDVKIRDKACFILGWMLLNRADEFISHSDYRVYPVRDAEKYFAMISPEGKYKYRIYGTIKALEKIKYVKNKNPDVAELLSIIPGGGFLYCGRYQDALVSFLLNSSLILAAYHSFKNNNNFLGGFISFVETGFYAGNIYGSVSSAHKYNKKKKKEFINNLKQKYMARPANISLHTILMNQGAALMFRYNF